jgi:hypothetical protein
MRPTQFLNLPLSGLKATFITYWSWGEKQEITKALMGETSINPTTQAVGDVLASNALELNKKALSLAVIKLEDKEGVETPVSELFDLPETDVELILDEIKKFDVSLKKK